MNELCPILAAYVFGLQTLQSVTNPRHTELIRSGLAVAVVITVLIVIRVCMINYTTAMRIRLDERMEERNRLARDMHDTLLQTIQFSKLVADDAQDEDSSPERMRLALKKLSIWLERASTEGRAVLDSLRVHNIDGNDLAAAFERALVECRLKADVDAVVSVKGSPVDLHPLVQDELFRIGYEAIRNACSHAQAGSIQVELVYRRNLILRVVDNGVGMEPTFLAKGKPGHYGIIGMKERAARVGGRLTITSDVMGTRVTLTVPHRKTLGRNQV